jgi:hypothetical protein
MHTTRMKRLTKRLTGMRYFWNNIIHGGFFGFPEQNRRICVPRGGPDIPVAFDECNPGDFECPRTIDLYKDESFGELYKRMGATYVTAGIED